MNFLDIKGENSSDGGKDKADYFPARNQSGSPFTFNNTPLYEQCFRNRKRRTFVRFFAFNR